MKCTKRNSWYWIWYGFRQRWAVLFYATVLFQWIANIAINFLQNGKIEYRIVEFVLFWRFNVLVRGRTPVTQNPSNSFQNWLHPVVSGLRCISPNDYTSPCGMDGMGLSPNAECALHCLAAEAGYIWMISILCRYSHHLDKSKSPWPHGITPTHDHAQHNSRK